MAVPSTPSMGFASPRKDGLDIWVNSFSDADGDIWSATRYQVTTYEDTTFATPFFDQTYEPPNYSQMGQLSIRNNANIHYPDKARVRCCVKCSKNQWSAWSSAYIYTPYDTTDITRCDQIADAFDTTDWNAQWLRWMNESDGLSLDGDSVLLPSKWDNYDLFAFNTVEQHLQLEDSGISFELAEVFEASPDTDAWVSIFNVRPHALVQHFALSPDRTKAALGFGYRWGSYAYPTMQVVDLSDMSVVANLPVSGNVDTTHYVAWRPDGAQVAATHGAGTRLTVWNTASWTKDATAPSFASGTIHGVAFSPDSSKMAVVMSVTPFLKVYNTSDWSVVGGTPTLTASPTVLKFSPDGTKLAIGRTTTPFITVLDTSTWGVITGPTSTVRISDLAWSPDSSMLALRSYNTAPYLRILQVSDWSVVPGSPSGVSSSWEYGIAFSADGSRFVSAGGPVYLTSDWSAVTGGNVTAIMDLAFKDNTHLVVSNYSSVTAVPNSNFNILTPGTYKPSKGHASLGYDSDLEKDAYQVPYRAYWKVKVGFISTEITGKMQGCPDPTFVDVWDPVTYKFLRVRDVEGEIRFDSSENGADWTNRATFLPSDTRLGRYGEIVVAVGGAGTATNKTRIRNINTTGGTGWLAPLPVTATPNGTYTLANIQAGTFASTGLPGTHAYSRFRLKRAMQDADFFYSSGWVGAVTSYNVPIDVLSGYKVFVEYQDNLGNIAPPAVLTFVVNYDYGSKPPLPYDDFDRGYLVADKQDSPWFYGTSSNDAYCPQHSPMAGGGLSLRVQPGYYETNEIGWNASHSFNPRTDPFTIQVKHAPLYRTGFWGYIQLPAGGYLYLANGRWAIGHVYAATDLGTFNDGDWIKVTIEGTVGVDNAWKFYRSADGANWGSPVHSILIAGADPSWDWMYLGAERSDSRVWAMDVESTEYPYVTFDNMCLGVDPEPALTVPDVKIVQYGPGERIVVSGGDPTLCLQGAHTLTRVQLAPAGIPWETAEADGTILYDSGWVGGSQESLAIYFDVFRGVQTPVPLSMLYWAGYYEQKIQGAYAARLAYKAETGEVTQWGVTPPVPGISKLNFKPDSVPVDTDLHTQGFKEIWGYGANPTLHTEAAEGTPCGKEIRRSNPDANSLDAFLPTDVGVYGGDQGICCRTKTNGDQSGMDGNLETLGCYSTFTDVIAGVMVRASPMDPLTFPGTRGGVLWGNGYVVSVGGAGTKLSIVYYDMFADWMDSFLWEELGSCAFGPVSINDWVAIKAEAKGNVIRAKAWVVPNPEPENWTLSVINNYSTAGAPGLFAAGDDDVEFTHVSIGTETVNPELCQTPECASVPPEPPPGGMYGQGGVYAPVPIACMKYLEIWTDLPGAGGIRLAFVPDYSEVMDKRELLGAESLTVKMPGNSPAWPFVRGKAVVRVVYYNGSDDWWRIQTPSDSHDNNDSLNANIECDGIKNDLGRKRFLRMLGTAVMQDFGLYQLTPLDHAGSIAESAPLPFVLGTIDPEITRELTLQYHGRSVQEAFNDLADATDSEFAVARISGTKNFGCHILKQVGSEAEFVQILYRKNIRGIRRSPDFSDLCNRIFPRGPDVDGLAFTITEAAFEVWTVTQVATGYKVTFDPDDIVPVAFVDQLKNRYIEVKTAIPRTLIRIVSCDPTDNSIVIESLPVPSGLAAGELVIFRADENGTELPWIDVPESQGQYGLYEGPGDGSDVPAVDNGLYDGFIDEWSGGQPSAWFPTGIAVIAQETDEMYHSLGNSSAHVTIANPGNGGITSAQDSCPVAPTQKKPYFSVQARLWIKSGDIYMEFDALDENFDIIQTFPDAGHQAHSDKFNNWIDLSIGGIDLYAIGAHYVQPRILTKDNAGGDFYLDAVMVTQTSSGVQEWYQESGSVALYRKGVLEVAEKMQPPTVYAIDLYDLYRFDPVKYPWEKFVLGATVLVKDDDFRTNFRGRIRALDRDHVRCAVTYAEIINVNVTLTSLLDKDRHRLDRVGVHRPPSRGPGGGTAGTEPPALSNFVMVTSEGAGHTLSWQLNKALLDALAVDPTKYFVRLVQSLTPMSYGPNGELIYGQAVATELFNNRNPDYEPGDGNEIAGTGIWTQLLNVRKQATNGYNMTDVKYYLELWEKPDIVRGNYNVEEIQWVGGSGVMVTHIYAHRTGTEQGPTFAIDAEIWFDNPLGADYHLRVKRVIDGVETILDDDLPVADVVVPDSVTLNRYYMTQLIYYVVEVIETTPGTIVDTQTSVVQIYY